MHFIQTFTHPRITNHTHLNWQHSAVNDSEANMNNKELNIKSILRLNHAMSLTL
jgi:hypothetical protein